LEGKLFRARFEEEVERIEHRHFGYQIDFDKKLGRLVRKHETRDVVAEWILLPVDKMFLWQNVERVAQNWRAAMRRGPQPDEVWGLPDRAIVGVVRPVVECDMNGHRNTGFTICYLRPNAPVPARNARE